MKHKTTLISVIRLIEKGDVENLIAQLMEELEGIEPRFNGELDYFIYPPSLEEMAEKGSVHTAFEVFVLLMSIIWERRGAEIGGEATKKRLARLQPVGKGYNRNKMPKISLLMASVNGAFEKIKYFNRKAWLRNGIFRINTNFEGYAYWNAAIFSSIAKKEKMRDEDISLVLRIIPFNLSRSPKAFWGPSGPEVNEKLSVLTREEEMFLWTTFCNNINNATAIYRENGGARLSNKDLCSGDCDSETTALIQEIQSILTSCRNTEGVLLKNK